MGSTVLYDQLSDRFDSVETPEWYPEAVSYLRGDKDRGLFGLYIYNLVRTTDHVRNIVNIGTARGHSAVCAAKGLQAAGRAGSVHTIDVIGPDEQRGWHDSQPDSDPLRFSETSMRELVGRFHEPEDEAVPIEFHTGDSNDVLPTLNISPDLVFHDGLHTYRTVKTDLDTANQLSSRRPIHVFDDCYLFGDEWTYRPLTSEFWYGLDDVSKLGSVIRTIRGLSVSKTPFPGVTMAVSEALADWKWSSTEIIRDPEHAPITALFPD